MAPTKEPKGDEAPTTKPTEPKPVAPDPIKERQAEDLELEAQKQASIGARTAPILLKAAAVWKEAGNAERALIAAQAAALRPDATKTEREEAKAFGA